MTPEEYLGRSNGLEIEMKRIRGILDLHALNKARGITTAGPHVQQAYKDLEDVIERVKALEREFWGDALE